MTEEISAYLDGELDPQDRMRVADLLTSSAAARAELDRLAAVRSLIRAGAAAPTLSEARALDTVVLAHEPPAQPRATPARPSPRKRGRPPWPYFAAAAALALVLSGGIAVLAQVLGRGSSPDTAAETTIAAVAPDAGAAPPMDGSGDATSAPGAAGGPLEQNQPNLNMQRPNSAASRPAEPELYLSGAVIAGASQLGGVSTGAPSPRWTREQAMNDLVGLGSAAGLDPAELSRCLGASGQGIPTRVVVGTYAGTPAYIVVLADPGSGAVTVVALARDGCALLATVAGER